MKTIKDNGKILTDIRPSWCPGCTNFLLLECVKETLEKLTKEGYKKSDFSFTTDIGCNSKIFDAINISGIYALHGRALPTGIGISIGNSNLKVLTFVGDGGLYAEGIEHFIHSFRYNADVTLIVHDNQSFSLTTGQSTPTSQQGFKSKLKPQGEENYPINPILLALSSGGTFIARCYARDIKHTSEVLEKAIKHKGFSFVEVIQECIIFNPYHDNKNERIYKIEDNTDEKKAIEYAKEFDYNTKEGKIPIGIIYKNESKPSLGEKIAQLKELKNKKMCFGDLRISN